MPIKYLGGIFNMTYFRRISPLLLAITLAGCNGGGGDSAASALDSTTSASESVTQSTDSDIAAPTSNLRYDVFFDGASVNVVNREADVPQAQPVFTIRDTSGAVPWHWQFNTASNIGTATQDITTDQIVFVDNGSFYRLNLINPQLPKVAQVSDENQAGLLCGKGNQWTSNAHSLAYQLPGADKVCGTSDDAYRRIFLSMDANTAPENIAQELLNSLPLYDSISQYSGSLSLASGYVVWRDATFANPLKLATYANAKAIYFLNVSLDYRYLLLAFEVATPDGKMGTHLHVLDQQNHTLSSSLGFTHDGSSMNGVYEFRMIGLYHGEFYLTRNQTDIVKLPVDGSSRASILIPNADGRVIVSDQLIALQRGLNGTTDIAHLSLDQPSATMSTLKTNIGYFHVTEKRVYFTQFATSNLGTFATTGSIKPDGSAELSYADSLLVGGSYANQTDRAKPNRITDQEIFMLQNLVFGDQYSGKSLAIVNADSGNAPLPPISIPASLSNFFVSSGSRGNTVLGAAIANGGINLRGVKTSAISNRQQLFMINTTSGKLTLMGNAHANAAWWSDWVAGQLEGKR